MGGTRKRRGRRCGHDAGGASGTTRCGIEATGALAMQAAPMSDPAEGPLDDPAPLRHDEALMKRVGQTAGSMTGRTVRRCSRSLKYLTFASEAATQGYARASPPPACHRERHRLRSRRHRPGWGRHGLERGSGDYLQLAARRDRRRISRTHLPRRGLGPPVGSTTRCVSRSPLAERATSAGTSARAALGSRIRPSTARSATPCWPGHRRTCRERSGIIFIASSPPWRGSVSGTGRRPGPHRRLQPPDPQRSPSAPGTIVASAVSPCTASGASRLRPTHASKPIRIRMRRSGRDVGNGLTFAPGLEVREAKDGLGLR